MSEAVLPASTAVPAEPDARSDDAARLFGAIGEYDNVTDVVHAAQAAYDAGYRKIDVHSPFPIHGIDDIIHIPKTILPWLVLGMGLLGTTTGFFLTMYTMSGFTDAADTDFWSFLWVNLQPYQYLISGKPFMGLPAYIPVLFELTIMFAAYTAVFAMFLLNRLPQHHHPLFKSERFRRATQDRFFLAVQADDREFDTTRTPALMKEHHAVSVELIRDSDPRD